MSKFFLAISFILSSICLSAQNGVYINNGAQWVCVGNPTITLKGISEFVNRGLFIADKSVVEIQDNNLPTILGTTNKGSSLNFFVLNINSTAGARLAQNISIDSNLTFLKGRLLLKNKVVQLSPRAAVRGENEARRLSDDVNKIGQVSITQTLGTTPNVNPGNLGFRIVSCAQPFGVTTVKRYCGYTPINGVTTGVIRRFYKINKQNNAKLNATLSFSYLNAELNGIVASTAVLWRSGDNGVTWISVVPDVRDTINKFLQKGSLNNFPDLWTIGSPTGSKMPVIIETVNVKGTNTENELTWSIEEDYPFDYFEIEKSDNAFFWNKIGEVNAIDVAHNYHFNDPFTGEAFYRLKQFDKEGNVTYSKIVKSDKPLKMVSILVYPNPAKNYFSLTFNSSREVATNIAILSSSGSIVKVFPVTVTKGPNNITLNIRGLTPGTYFIKIKEKDLEFTRPIVVQ